MFPVCKRFQFRAVALSLAVLVFAILADAQLAVPNNADPKYAISGTVVNSVTGEPIRRALVQIFAGAQESMLTDSSGHFEFSDLPAGQTTVSARKPGFFSDQEVGGGPGGLPNLARIGPNAAPITVKLIPEGIIAGRIVSRDGEPLDNLPVRILRSGIMNGRRHWELLGDSNTDDDGQFRVGNLKPGLYYLKAGPSLEPTWLGPPGAKAREAAFPETYYNGGRDLSSATPIQLAPGQQVQADFSINPEPVFRVSGVVDGVGENEGMNIEFTSESGDPLPTPTGYSSEAHFISKLAAGSYVVKATAFGQGSPRIGLLNLTVNSDVTGVRIPLAPLPTIPVKATFQETRSRRPPVRNVNTVMIRVSRVGPSFENWEQFVAIGGNPDPAANSIRDLTPGRYAVEITPQNPEWYVRSAQCGGTDLLRDDLVVAPGAQIPPIEIVLRDDSARITGTAVSAGSQMQLGIITIPDAAPRAAKLTYSGANFVVTGLAPGDYSVIAVDRPEALEYSNPEALAPYMSGATRVSVVANGESNIVVNVSGVNK